MSRLKPKIITITSTPLITALRSEDTRPEPELTPSATSPSNRVSANAAAMTDTVSAAAAGVYGETASTSVDKAAVYGVASDAADGVYGESAHGDGVSGLIIEAVAECEKVMPGDWLVTSDAEPHLRTEVRIGVVQEVIVNPADRRFVTVKVKPFVDPATLRDVYIVYWKPPL